LTADIYKTIKRPSEGIFKEKGSKFISFIYPVNDQEDVKPILDRLRKDYHDARHHCFAYVIGSGRNIFRSSDDGEPSGTAGRPILGQINSFGLTNILIVVVRYFGGTLLGVSGLINAYRSAAESAITNSEIIEATLKEYFEITFPYAMINDVMKIIKEEEISHTNQSFDNICSIIISFRTSVKENIFTRFKRFEGLKWKYLETR